MAKDTVAKVKKLFLMQPTLAAEMSEIKCMKASGHQLSPECLSHYAQVENMYMALQSLRIYTVDVYIFHLRKKLAINCIQTVIGRGYRLSGMRHNEREQEVRHFKDGQNEVDALFAPSN